MKTLAYLSVILFVLVSCEKEESEMKTKSISYIDIESIEMHLINDSQDSMMLTYKTKFTNYSLHSSKIKYDTYYGGPGYVNKGSQTNETDTVEITITKLKNTDSKVKIVLSTWPGYVIDKNKYFESEEKYQYYLSTYYEYYIKESTSNPIKIKGVLYPSYPYFKEL